MRFAQWAFALSVVFVALVGMLHLDDPGLARADTGNKVESAASFNIKTIIIYYPFISMDASFRIPAATPRNASGQGRQATLNRGAAFPNLPGICNSQPLSGRRRPTRLRPRPIR